MLTHFFTIYCTIIVQCFLLFAKKVRAHFPELRSGRSSLVVIDGEMKSLTSEFIEQVTVLKMLIVYGGILKK